MAIDIMRDMDELYPLDIVVKLVPRLRGGAGCTPTTLRKWIRTGLLRPDGSRLKPDAIRVGKRWATTPDALKAFFAALSSPPQPAA